VQRYFKVRWYGTGPEEDTWQDLASLDHQVREYAWQDEQLGRSVRRELRGGAREQGRQAAAALTAQAGSKA
jgi:hypothetical protein